MSDAEEKESSGETSLPLSQSREVVVLRRRKHRRRKKRIRSRSRFKKKFKKYAEYSALVAVLAIFIFCLVIIVVETDLLKDRRAKKSKSSVTRIDFIPQPNLEKTALYLS